MLYVFKKCLSNRYGVYNIIGLCSWDMVHDMRLRHRPRLGTNLCWLGMVPLDFCTESARDVFAQEILQLANSYGVELAPLKSCSWEVLRSTMWEQELPEMGRRAEWAQKRDNGM